MEKKHEVTIYFGADDYLIFDLTMAQIGELYAVMQSRGIYNLYASNQLFVIDTARVNYVSRWL